MSNAAQSGWYQGSLFFIEAKPDGTVKAVVDETKERFGTWDAAKNWVRDEAERRYRERK